MNRLFKLSFYGCRSAMVGFAARLQFAAATRLPVTQFIWLAAVLIAFGCALPSTGSARDEIVSIPFALIPLHPPAGKIVLPVADVDDAAPTLNNSGRCQSADVAVHDNDEPDLCEALRKQAKRAAGHGETLCSLPAAESGLGLARPNWSPVDPSAIEPLLRQYLPLFGWDTRGVQDLIKKEMPHATREELLAEHWQRYGPAMMEALRSGKELLQTTVMDVDNDGSTERVYRTAILQPIDKKRPELGWQPLPCNGEGNASDPGAEIIPYRALFFEQSKQSDMGIMADFDKIEGLDLFLFKGRSYLVAMDPSMIAAERIQVQKLPNTPQQALFFQVCLIER